MVFDTIEDTEFAVLQVVVVRRTTNGDPIGILHVGRDRDNVQHVKVERYDNFAGNYKNRHVHGMIEGLRYGVANYAEVVGQNVDTVVLHLRRLLQQRAMLMSCSCDVGEWLVDDRACFSVAPIEDSTHTFNVILNRAGEAQEVSATAAQALMDSGESLPRVLELAEVSIAPNPPNGLGAGGAVCGRCGGEMGLYWVGTLPLPFWPK
jgi:hypothetical protein